VWTEDKVCCEGELDRCGICDGNDTACHWKGVLSFHTDASLTADDITRACGALRASLASVVKDVTTIVCEITCTPDAGGGPTGRRLADAGSVTEVQVELELPMADAGPETLTQMQVIPPGALFGILR
jgi:hypothetical protein